MLYCMRYIECRKTMDMSSLLAAVILLPNLRLSISPLLSWTWPLAHISKALESIVRFNVVTGRLIDEGILNPRQTDI